jgi:hypothetical protein
VEIDEILLYQFCICQDRFRVLGVTCAFRIDCDRPVLSTAGRVLRRVFDAGPSRLSIRAEGRRPKAFSVNGDHRLMLA